MNNKELEKKIKDIVFQENYFDMIELSRQFEKEYKKSDFYMSTKKPLDQVIKEAQIFYNLNLGIVGQRIQNILNDLDTSNIMNVFDKIGDITMQQFLNLDRSFNEFKDYTKDLKTE